NCQNYHISQLSERENRIEGEMVTPEEVVVQAVEYSCKSIAYTYTEPTIFYEFALDVAKLAHQKGLKNIFITNGYITPEALQTIAPYLDAANVDLKSFSKKFYHSNCKAKMQPVLDTLKLLKKLGIWFEVTTLVIPTLNDSNEQLQAIAEFIIGLGKEIPWHISAFYPAYQLKDIPPTPRRLLYRAWEIGLNFGLHYVYIDNIDTTEFTTTHCHNCGRSLIRRKFYVIVKNCISNTRCPFCSAVVAGILLDSERESDQYDISTTI
ncbi:MAG: AmmeMemoRadiSam system radical SAM enzyme, partial [bacterium]